MQDESWSKYLKEGMEADVLTWSGTVVGVQIANVVTLQVRERAGLEKELRERGVATVEQPGILLSRATLAWLNSHRMDLRAKGGGGAAKHPGISRRRVDGGCHVPRAGDGLRPGREGEHCTGCVLFSHAS